MRSKRENERGEEDDRDHEERIPGEVADGGRRNRDHAGQREQCDSDHQRRGASRVTNRLTLVLLRQLRRGRSAWLQPRRSHRLAHRHVLDEPERHADASRAERLKTALPAGRPGTVREAAAAARARFL